jgi:glycosyltransferase involved in cell wall biosynthesis
LRIGVLSQWYDPEPGPAAVPGTVARGLRDAGHEVVVLTGFPNYPTGQLVEGYRLRPHQVEHQDGIEVHRVPLFPSHDRSAWRRAANYLSFAGSATIAARPVLGQVDVVWIYNSPITIGLPSALLQVAGHVPTILHVQDLWPDSVIASGLLMSSRARRVAERVITTWAALTYRLATTIAVISPGMSDLLITRGVPADKIHWVPNCADERLFRPVPYDHELAEEIGATRRFTLMYGGSLGAIQGLDTAIHAAALLQDRPEFQLLLVGSGVAEAGLRDLAAELGLDNVRFLGRRPSDQMPSLMRIADALLISLRDERFLAATMPSKVAAALASGRPVIAAAHGDPADVVRASGAGVSCAPGDPAGLAAAVRRLLDLPVAERAAMGRLGRAYAAQYLSPERCVERLELLCQQATRSRHSTASAGLRASSV